jgi:DNA (cytosine-5)-methyltransferase 1
MRVGSLCTGIGGLDLAVGGDLAFVAEIDPNPSAVLDQRFPGVPNLGDWTAYDELPEVDLLIGGLPCQPISVAGPQAGTADERWLFDDFARLVGRMGNRPRLFLENVPAILSVEDGDAISRAIRPLAELGYVGAWRCVTAASVGACHRRNRWFCFAADPDGVGSEWAGGSRHRGSGSPHNNSVAAHPDSDAGGRDSGTTPSSQEADGRRSEPDNMLGSRTARSGNVWAEYAPAIARWEHVTGRPAPAATIDGRLSHLFVEWMQDLPAGWVTDVLPRRASLKALGNCVVRSQARAAYLELEARVAR